MEKNKSNKQTLSLVFKVLAAITVLAGIVLGFIFGADEVQRFSYTSQVFVTEKVFELWRAFIFWFTGLCSGICLFSVSLVFDTLTKKK